MAIVAPSILSADFADLARSCDRVCEGIPAPWLHIDVMDGVFVPNLSLGPVVLAGLSRQLGRVFYDVHLMITKPHEYVEAFCRAGANSITFHVEAESEIGGTLEHIKASGMKAGLSLRPGTPVEALFPYLPELDLVLVMSVEPGFGGQAFNPGAPERIRALREEAGRQKPDLLISVDGGINGETGALCTAAGADILVAGNYVFRAECPEEKVRQLAAL